jgi:hypothetical protein
MRNRFAILALIALFIGSTSTVSYAQRKAKKHPSPDLPALPVGSTGPLPQKPLDSMSPETPEVSYRDGELTIIALNSTLAEILRCVRKQTGAEIEIPAANERVVTHLGPGPVTDVLSELLNGSHFNYVLIGSPSEPARLTRVVLLAKSVPDATNLPAQRGAIARTVPTQAPVHENADIHASDPPGVETPPDASHNLDVNPAPQTDGPVEMSD